MPEEEIQAVEQEVSYDPLTDLLALVEDIKVEDDSDKDPYENLSVEETLSQRIIDGNKTNINTDLQQALDGGHKPLDIINKFLMDGMKIVGERFGAGEMQLPFVLQSATTMKTAVSYLEQFMDKLEASTNKGTVVLATVKGDVHDIGKNLVDIILSNNGYKVHNLGIKIPVEEIIRAVEEFKPNLIALSGLLVKSTLIMKQNLEVLNERGIDLPIILGGAALTRRFVEQDCANTYNGYVYYGYDAFTDLDIMERIHSGKSFEEIKEEFYKTKAKESEGDSPYQEVGESDEDEYAPLLDYTEKLSETKVLTSSEIPELPFYGDRLIGPEEIDLDEMWQYLNLDAMIIGQWRMGKGKKTQEEYDKLLKEEIYPTLERLKKETRANPWLKPKIVYGYYHCKIDPEHPNKLNLFSEDKEEIIDSFTFPRQNSGEHLCLSDYFRTEDDAFNLVGFQLVTIGVEAAEFVQSLYNSGDFAEYLYYYGLATESTEALAEYSHARIRKELGYQAEDNKDDIKKLLRGGYHGMRYSFGYPACPRLEDQEKLFTLFKPERIGMKLSEEWQIHPEHSTSAIIIHHPDAKYYNVKVK
ncbi:MAG: B12-binding domain-containing protein [Candidatus Caenarcaniphilales bacterium]|nr:B12-binding domain-containing protein [Candidatus Caenarcaniphilales bacterium]